MFALRAPELGYAGMARRKYLLVLFTVAACTDGGVSSHPPAGMSWNDALEAFAAAHCQWNYDCDGRHDDGCPDEVLLIMNQSTKPELAPGTEDDCIACMQAWTTAYDTDTMPTCTHSLSFEQSQSISMACAVTNCVENHDLPGTNPQ